MRNLAWQRAMLVLTLTLLSWAADGSGTRSLAGVNEKPDRALDFVEQMTLVVKFGPHDDPQTTLADLLDLLEKRYIIKFSVNERAFKFDKVLDVMKTEVALPDPIPEMKANLRFVLEKILDRIPASSKATYVFRKESIEITTMAALRKELGRKDEERLLPLTYARFEKRPLDEALKHLSERSGVSVLLDPRVGDKTRRLVSGTFKNVPLDTAVRVLADMADLELVLQDNVLYVTTRGKAARMEQEQRNREALLPEK
jgi:hypothetical protein